MRESCIKQFQVSHAMLYLFPWVCDTSWCLLDDYEVKCDLQTGLPQMKWLELQLCFHSSLVVITWTDKPVTNGLHPKIYLSNSIPSLHCLIMAILLHFLTTHVHNIAKNNSSVGMKNLLELVVNSTHINVILMSAPHRYHLMETSCVNYIHTYIYIYIHSFLQFQSALLLKKYGTRQYKCDYHITKTPAL